MTFSHIHRETGELVGDPDDEPIHELIGEGPPCDKCGRRHAVEKVRDADLCEPCADDDERDDQEASADA